MTFDELMVCDIRLGDILSTVHTYSNLSPFTYSGIVVSTNPILIYPWSGNNGFYIPTAEARASYEYTKVPLILRIMNILGAYKLIRNGGVTRYGHK